MASRQSRTQTAEGFRCSVALVFWSVFREATVYDQTFLNITAERS
jgi:hypothetical protein